MKIIKGDTVKVISGKDIGKEGKVLKVLPKKNQVLVEGINIVKKHQKPQGQTMQGGVIDKTMPIHISNVAIVVKNLINLIGLVKGIEFYQRQVMKYDPQDERKI